MRLSKFLLPLFLETTVSCSQTLGSPGIFGERHYKDIDYSLYLNPNRGRIFIWEYDGVLETAIAYRNAHYSGNTHYTEVLYLQKFYPCPLDTLKDILDYRFGENKPRGLQVIPVSCPIPEDYYTDRPTQEEYDSLVEICEYLGIGYEAVPLPRE